MGFTDAISSGFRNYVNFSNRAPRSAFWYWVLFGIIALIVAGVIDGVLFIKPDSTVYPLFSLVYLALILPWLAVSVRRLHDIDRSGWWVLLGLIPIVGPIILLVWYCQKGTPGANRFGSDPLAGHA
jgi:uncharacterized membrane protein YhaH (DUF805 family)